MQHVKNPGHDELRRLIDGFVASLGDDHKEVFLFENGANGTLNFLIQVTKPK